jgi:hypothetical protein
VVVMVVGPFEDDGLGKLREGRGRGERRPAGVREEGDCLAYGRASERRERHPGA